MPSVKLGSHVGTCYGIHFLFCVIYTGQKNQNYGLSDAQTQESIAPMRETNVDYSLQGLSVC